MKPNEVRIGNKVYDTEGEENTVGIEALKYLLAYGGTRQCQVKPIPITEEWLERMRYTKSPYWVGGYILLRDNLYLEQRLFSDSWFTYLRYGRDVSQKQKLTGCIYVHQIQNLYFALTGEELEIKPLKEVP